MTLAEKILNVTCSGYEIKFSYDKRMNTIRIFIVGHNNMSIYKFIKLDDLFEMNVLNEEVLISAIDDLIYEFKNPSKIDSDHVRHLNFADNPTQ